MAVLFDGKTNIIQLDTLHTSYQMKVDEYGVVLHTYYGKKVPLCDMSYGIDYTDRGFCGNPYELERDKTYSMDCLPQEMSGFGTGDYRSDSIRVKYADGTRAISLRYVSHEITDGKYSLPGLPALYAGDTPAQTLKLVMKDTAHDFYVTLYYGVLSDLDIITRTVQVENKEQNPVVVEKLMSACLDFFYEVDDMMVFRGKHTMERQLDRLHIHHGRQSIGSSRGSSSHQANPFVILCNKNATETQGSCYGFSFAYSGNFMAEVEKNQIHSVRLTMGIHPDMFEWTLDAGADLFMPEVIMAYSHHGFEALSQIYHKALREHMCRGKFKLARRPVLLNSWEGCYFDFDGAHLIRMAKAAAEMGIELFVMDDGWFGKRDADVSGLGDWFPNEKKLGCTLKELGDGIRAAGCEFGIWFEPEAVSEDSDLYRAHPEWAITIPGRKPTRSRFQLTLDLSRPEVRDYLYEKISAVLDSAPITYVKWDFNCNISDWHSGILPAERQGEFPHRYILGLYDLLERITSAYPDVLFEGCSGGGGRYDAGMLYYTPQIWCSDNTDCIERIRIQYGTSFCYPISTIGSHVSASPNHQTGRETPFESRGTVAMSGTFGYELDPLRMSAEEKAMVKEQIAHFTSLYELIQHGHYYRLVNPWKERAVAAWEFVSGDGSEALLCAVQNRVYPNPKPEIIRMRGLNREAAYKVELYPKKELGPARVTTREPDYSGRTFLGAELMEMGLRIPYPRVEYDSWEFHITQV